METFYNPICRHCGKPLEKVNLQCFMHDGSDDSRPTEIYCIKNDKGDFAVSISTNTNWCGYDLTDEERKEDISCPHCGHYPFGSEEIEIHEPVNLCCWTDRAEPIESPETIQNKALAAIVYRINENLMTDDPVLLTGLLMHIRETATNALAKGKEMKDATK